MFTISLYYFTLDDSLVPNLVEGTDTYSFLKVFDQKGDTRLSHDKSNRPVRVEMYFNLHTDPHSYNRSGEMASIKRRAPPLLHIESYFESVGNYVAIILRNTDRNRSLKT